MTSAVARPRASVDEADVEALARCAGGHETALAEICTRHAAACFGLALSILRDRGYAQDAVQEAYLQLWRNADRFDSRQSSVRSWLLLTTRSKAIDRVRHEQRRRASVLPDDHDAVEQHRGPEAEAILAELKDEVRALLGTLSPPKREALLLAYWGGYTQREVAELTNAPLGTVKTRMLHGLRELRRALEASADLDELSRMTAGAVAR